MSAYIDIGIDIDIRKDTDTLNSKRSHTFILIHNNIYTLKRRIQGFQLTEESNSGLPYTNMNINIHARVGF